MPLGGELSLDMMYRTCGTQLNIDYDSEEDFIAWTKSESFRLAHKNAGNNKDIYIGHPEFEGFEVIL